MTYNDNLNIKAGDGHAVSPAYNSTTSTINLTKTNSQPRPRKQPC